MEILEFEDRVGLWLDHWLRRSPPYRVFGPDADRGMLYREGDHLMKICLEHTPGAPEGTIMIYGDSTRHWEPPYEKEPISKEKRRQIVERVGATFKNTRWFWYEE